MEGKKIPLSEGRVACTYGIDRHVELLTSDGTVKIIAGSREKSNKKGYWQTRSLSSTHGLVHQG